MGTEGIGGVKCAPLVGLEAALAAFVRLAEQRRDELGELSPDMAKCLQDGAQALASQQFRPDHGGVQALVRQLREIADSEHSTSQNAVDDKGYLPADVTEVLDRAADALAAMHAEAHTPFAWHFLDHNPLLAQPADAFTTNAETAKAVNGTPLFRKQPAQAVAVAECETSPPVAPAASAAAAAVAALTEAIEGECDGLSISTETASAILAHILPQGVSLVAMRAVAAQESAIAFAPPAETEEPLPMSTAPRDGTLIRLLVDFTGNATSDSGRPSWTIGSNGFDANEEDVWDFAGWCWSHDHFTQGHGTPIGWLPMLGAKAVDLGAMRKVMLDAIGRFEVLDQHNRLKVLDACALQGLRAAVALIDKAVKS